MSFNDVANVSTEVNNYKIHFWYISRKKSQIYLKMLI